MVAEALGAETAELRDAIADAVAAGPRGHRALRVLISFAERISMPEDDVYLSAARSIEELRHMAEEMRAVRLRLGVGVSISYGY